MMDPRGKTGGWGWEQAAIFCIIDTVTNLTQRFYSYLLCSHPMSCLLFYLVCYVSFGQYIQQIGKIFDSMELDTRTPRINPWIRYHTGRWRHIPSHLSTGLKHRHGYKKSKYKRESTSAVLPNEWGSVHHWKALLELDYSSMFDRNCNRFNHYLDTTMGNLESVPKVQSIVQYPSCLTGVEDDMFLPIEL